MLVMGVMCEDRDSSVRHFCKAALPRSPWWTAWVDRTGSQGQGTFRAGPGSEAASKVWAPFLTCVSMGLGFR